MFLTTKLLFMLMYRMPKMIPITMIWTMLMMIGSVSRMACVNARLWRIRYLQHTTGSLQSGRCGCRQPMQGCGKDPAADVLHVAALRCIQPQQLVSRAR